MPATALLIIETSLFRQQTTKLKTIHTQQNTTLQ